MPFLGRMLVVLGKMVVTSILCRCVCPFGIGIFPVLFRRGCRRLGAWVALVSRLLLGVSLLIGVGVPWFPFVVILAEFQASKKGTLYAVLLLTCCVGY